MDFKLVSHGLWSGKQNILQHMHKKELWILMNKCGNNLKNENEAGEPWPFSLVFVFKIISTFIGQNPKFCYACVEEGCSASPTIAREKQTLNPFHLRWS